MGNANSGRRPNERPIRAVLTDILDEIDAQTERKRLWNICYKLVEQAEAGDLNAARDVFDRLEGKPKQTTEHAGPNGGGIPHTLTLKFG